MRMLRCVTCVLSTFFTCIGIYAQGSADQIVPTAVTDQNRTGPLPFSTSFGGSVDQVDVSGGNLSIHIPLFHIKSRGQDFNISLRYQTNFYTAVPFSGGGANYIWTGERRNYFYGALGWELNEPYLMSTRTNEHLACLGDTLPPVYSGNPTPAKDGTLQADTNLIFTDEDGAKHSMDAQEGSAGCPDNPINGAFSFFSPGPDLTNSGLWIGPGVNPGVGASSTGLTAMPMLDAGGTSFQDGDASTATALATTTGWFHMLPIILDVDGNQQNQLPNGSDTLGRTPITESQSGNTVTLSYTDSNGSAQNIQINLTTIHYGTNFNQTTAYGGGPIYDIDEGPNGPVTSAISSIVLSNGTSYQFTYGPSGYMSSMQLPTGGVIQYQTANFLSQDASRIYISSRTEVVGSQTNTTSLTVSCSTPGAGCAAGPYQSTLISADSKLASFVSTGGNISSATYYDGLTSASPIRKQFTLCYWNPQATPPQTGCFGPYIVAPGNADPLPIAIVETLDGVTSRIEYDYDSFTYMESTLLDVNACASDLADCVENGVYPSAVQGSRGNVTAIRQYDWGTGGNWGPLLKQTIKTYLHDTNPNYFYNQGNPAVVYNVVDRVRTDSVYDGSVLCHGGQSCSANLMAQTTYGYDEDGAGYRGRVTSVNKWVNLPTPHTDTTTYAYDTYGNILSVTDPKHNTTTWSYADNWTAPNGACLPPAGSSAFPTVKQDALGHVMRASYYPCTGLAASVQDPNDLAQGRAGTQLTYDSMARLINTSFPDGGSTTTTFNDQANTVDTRKLLSASNAAETLILKDGLGRTTQTRLVSDPAGADYTDTTYDAMDRVSCISNPYRGTSNAQTCTSYDALGRPQTITEQDGNQVQYVYSGNQTTTKDEAGNSTTRTSDALGRLTQVLEPGSLFTSYVYDPLGNLKSVYQQGISGETPRTRSFTYDSLSRLLTATNPETGTNSYQYDSNGNLLYKTDANGSTLIYTYDALNRLLSKSASPSSWDVNATLTYDQGVNGIGHLTGESTPYESGTQFTYDLMGRISGTQWANLVAGLAWQPGMGVLYDLAGNVTQLTYPDGRVVTQTVDGAGRLASVSDATPSGPGTAYFSGAQYWPSGAIMKSAYGNGVTQSFQLNNRLQPCWSTASTSLLAPNSNGGNLYDRSSYYSGDPTSNCSTEQHNNGNIWSIVDNRNPNQTQGFTYDSLNRLRYAARSDGAYNHTYNIDSFGNMTLQDNLHGNPALSIDPATNRLLQNVSDLQYYPNGELASSPGNVYWYTPEGYLRSINAFQTGSYLYNSLGERTLAVQNNATYLEYVYLNGQPMADLNSNGNWTDYIYANGQKIARVAQTVPTFHAHVTRNAWNLPCGAEWGMTTAGGTPIGEGDRLAVDMKQTNAVAGVALVLSPTVGTAALSDMTTGQNIYQNTDTDGQWHHYVGDLSPWAGQTVWYSLIGVQNPSPAGESDIWAKSMVILKADGSVVPIITSGGIPSLNYAANPCAGDNETLTAEQTPVSDPNIAASYYLDDHLGTTQMELSSGGWPVWSGAFTPFGQEIINGTTTNYIGAQPADGTAMRYKFTGKERDSESGLDYFGARYYASNMGRWMSPDWSAKEEPVPYAKLGNPQSLNLYGYVNNNPLGAVDPDGHELHIIIVNTSNQSASTTSAVASGVQQKFEAAGVKNVTVEVVNTSSSFKTYMEDAKGAFGPHTATVELAAGPGQEKGSVGLDKGTNGDTQPRGVSVVDANGVASQQGVKDPTTAITNVTAHEVGHDVLDDAKQNSNSDLMSPVGTIPLLNNKNAQFSPADAKKLSDTLNTDKEKKQ